MATEAKYLYSPSGRNNPECGIKAYLDKAASEDALFALKYMDGRKTIVGAIQYIMHINMGKEPTNVRAHIKDLHVDSRTFGFIDTDSDKDNQLAYEYFMDDSLDYEPKAKAETPVPAAAPAAAPKTETPKTETKKKARTVKPVASKQVSPAAKPVQAAVPQTDEIDLFAGLFD